MSMETGTGAGSAYEYVMAEKPSGMLRMKKIALILLYVFWALGVLIVGAALKFFVYLLAFIPITLWILVFLTWRYTQVEYEFSFLSGQLTVSRILGGRTRKVLAKITVREASAILPVSDSNAERIDGNAERVNAFAPQKTVFALSHTDAAGIYALLWEADGKRSVLWFEPNERALKILKYYNTSAFCR